MTQKDPTSTEDKVEELLAKGLLEQRSSYDGVRYRFAGADEHEAEGEEKWLTRAEILAALETPST